jgi:hypothetical protein
MIRQTGPPIGAPAGHTHAYKQPCSPGGDCCDSCRASKMGTVTCDSDGNCYDDSTGTYTTPSTFTGLATAIGNNPSSIGSSLSTFFGSINPTILIAVGIGALFLYMDAGSSGGRKGK